MFHMQFIVLSLPDKQEHAEQQESGRAQALDTRSLEWVAQASGNYIFAHNFIYAQYDLLIN